MSTLLQIRNVPEDTKETLKVRAREAGKSLNSYVLDLLEREADRPTIAEVLERAASRTRGEGPGAVQVVARERTERDQHWGGSTAR